MRFALRERTLEVYRRSNARWHIQASVAGDHGVLAFVQLVDVANCTIDGVLVTRGPPIAPIANLNVAATLRTSRSRRKREFPPRRVLVFSTSRHFETRRRGHCISAFSVSINIPPLNWGYYGRIVLQLELLRTAQKKTESFNQAP